MAELEEETGKQTPPILLLRLSSDWVRQHTKAYMTPTILKKWKDSMPPKVAMYFFHECDIVAIEDAYFFDFDKSIGEEILDKMIIGTCYAFLNITGESSHHGTWFQGKKVWDEVNRAKCTAAANVLIKLCKSKNFKTKDDFLNNYLEGIKEGTLTCNLQPIAFTGELRLKLVG